MVNFNLIKVFFILASYISFTRCVIYTTTTHTNLIGVVKKKIQSSSQAYKDDIKAPPGYIIYATLVNFNIGKGVLPDCYKSNTLKVYSGCLFKLVSTLCGSYGSLSPLFVTKDNCMRIEYTGDSNVGDGYSLTYEMKKNNQAMSFTPHSNEKCSHKSTSSGGIIASPSWPLSYYGRDTSSCNFAISIPYGKAINFYFMDIDTYAPNYGRNRCYVNGNDYIELKATGNEERSYRFCHLQSPFHRYYSNDFKHIDFTFHVKNNQGSQLSKGFVVGYIIFNQLKTDDDDSKDNPDSEHKIDTFRLALGIPFIVVVVVISCIVKKQGGWRAVMQRMNNSNQRNNRSTHAEPMPQSTRLSEIYRPQNPGSTYPPPQNSAYPPPQNPAYPPPQFQQVMTTEGTNAHQLPSAGAYPPPPSYDAAMSNANAYPPRNTDMPPVYTVGDHTK